MKTLRASLPLVLLLGSAAAQVAPPPAPAAPAAPEAPAAYGSVLSAEQLEQLLAPIALYPDALIALILPATVASTDVVLAARHLREFPQDRSQIEHRAWDESVKSLTHYPEVLQWLDENLPWTKQVGEAFAQQPAEVMQAVQRLRARARAAGTLIDTPQQQVLAEPEVIRIVRAQPDIIYVPRYEPDIVFVHEPVRYTRPLLTFGVGVRAGSWLASDCDWRRRTIWIGDRRRTWRGHDWHRPLVPIAPAHAHAPVPGFRAWTPPARTSHVHVAVHHRTTDIVRPNVIGSPRVPTRTWSGNYAPSPRPSPTITPRVVGPAPAAAMARSHPSPRLHTTPRVAPNPVSTPHYTSPSPPAGHHLHGASQPILSARGPETRPSYQRPARANPGAPASIAPQMTSPQPPAGFSSASSAPRMTLRPSPRTDASRSAPAASPSPAPANEAPAPAAVRPAENPPRSPSQRYGRRGDHNAQR